MKSEAMAVLVLAREKAKATNLISMEVKPKLWDNVSQNPPVKDDGRQDWERFKTECVLLTKKEV